ncbi:MAG: hypothetical protein KU38_04385 [Sulfurovum sp. FS08-3]|nr:MAG: hypothetical protein KU38_04385 [Sulfurovum sp. FS08-3]
MVIVHAKIPTYNLPVWRSLPKLFQSFVYTTLDDKEHEGYKHPNGKVFKSMNFKLRYYGHDLDIYYNALDKEHEKRIAQEILLNGLKLGAIHIASSQVELQRREAIGETIKVGGFVAVGIKDGKMGKNKIYIEPKTDKFQEIIHNNILQKYEALFGEPYVGKLVIKPIHQKPNPKIFHYSQGVIKAWYAIYQIQADKKMLELILDTGMGEKTMQGLGFVEAIIRKEKQTQ